MAYPTSGAYPIGAYPMGAYSRGAYPRGAYPSGAYPNMFEPSSYQTCNCRRELNDWLFGSRKKIDMMLFIVIVFPRNMYKIVKRIGSIKLK